MVELEVVLKENSYGYGFALEERTNDATPDETGFYIHDVLEKEDNDHSSRSMLRVGDRLLAVNGVKVDKMTAERIRDLLTKSCQGLVCLTIQPQDDSTNDTRGAILKNIPDYEKNNSSSLLKKSLKKMRRIFEQPKGNFRVTVKRNSKKTLGAQILGGCDEPILNGYSGIHLLNIGDEDFKTVFGNEKLQIGDRILSVNGLRIDDVPKCLVTDILSGKRLEALKEIEHFKLMPDEEIENEDKNVDNEDILLLEANRLSSIFDENAEDMNNEDGKHWCMGLLPKSPIAAEVLVIFSLSFFLSFF